MARSSARSRATMAAVSLPAKLGGSLRFAAASTMAIMSAGRRPKKKRSTSSGVSGIPARVNSSAATAAAIGSLSTSTPLQSKMITKAPAPRTVAAVHFLYAIPRHESLRQDRNRALMAKVGHGPGRRLCTELLSAGDSYVS